MLENALPSDYGFDQAVFLQELELTFVVVVVV